MNNLSIGQELVVYVSIIIIILSIAAYFWIYLRPSRRQNIDDIERILSLNDGQLASSRDEHKSPSTIQLELLKDYHSQSLSHSSISFTVSTAFAVIGFLAILMGIYTVDRSHGLSDQSLPIISLIAGVITESVSILFFWQTNKNRIRMIDFFDKLRIDKKSEESLIIANEIPDELLRSKLKMILSLNFAQINTTDEVITMVFREMEHKDSSKI